LVQHPSEPSLCSEASPADLVLVLQPCVYFFPSFPNDITVDPATDGSVLPEGVNEYTTCDNLLTTSSSTWPKTSVFEIAAGGVPLSKIVIGKPATTADANNGFMSTSTLANCLQQAKAKGWSTFLTYQTGSKTHSNLNSIFPTVILHTLNLRRIVGGMTDPSLQMAVLWFGRSVKLVRRLVHQGAECPFCSPDTVSSGCLLLDHIGAVIVMASVTLTGWVQRHRAGNVMEKGAMSVFVPYTTLNIHTNSPTSDSSTETDANSGHGLFPPALRPLSLDTGAEHVFDLMLLAVPTTRGYRAPVLASSCSDSVKPVPRHTGCPAFTVLGRYQKWFKWYLLCHECSTLV